MGYKMKLNKKVLKEVGIIISDVDGCIIKDRIAYCAFGLIKEELKEGRLYNAFRGYVHGIKVALRTKIKECVEIDNWGLKECIKILGKSKIPRQRIYSVAKRYSQRNSIDGISELFDIFKKDYGYEIHLSTLTGDTFAMPIADKYDTIGITSQEIKYEMDYPVGVNFRIKTPLDKLIETENDLKEEGFDLKDAIVIGDSDTDGVFAKSNVKLFICSPLTKSKKLREKSDIELNMERNYSYLVKELKELS